MPFDAGKLGQYQSGMRRRIDELRRKAEDSLDFAIEHMMEERVDSFFRVEEGLEEIGRSVALIEEELEQVLDMSGAARLESRLEFIEDRFEDLDSEVRQRPRRRRKKINLADFFRAAGGNWGEPTVRREVSSAVEAYRILGLEHGGTLNQVTTAFRQRAKRLHPDARRGDRSTEPELRRIIEAYQYLKEHLSLSRTEPPEPEAPTGAP